MVSLATHVPSPAEVRRMGRCIVNVRVAERVEERSGQQEIEGLREIAAKMITAEC